jgi:regulatory protein
MAKITKIKAQKKEGRANIFLDGKFAFGLPLEAILEAGLKVGQELSEKEVKELIFKNQFQKFLDKATHFVSFRPRSEKEVKNYLCGKLSERKKNLFLLDKILEKLKDLELLEDKKFALWWVEQRSTFRPRGRLFLKSELRRKGVDEKIIKEVLTSALDEVALAKKAIQKKLRVWRRLAPRERDRKLSTFLSRRGFSWEVIKEALVDQRAEIE